MKIRIPAERAIIYCGVLGGLTLEEINAMLPSDSALVASSYEMMRGEKYFDYMVQGIGNSSSSSMNVFGELIYHPKAIGNL